MPKGPHGGMQLVLTEDVQHLGKQGDVVEVKAGLRPQLPLPRGMATCRREHNLRLLERYKIRVQQAREARIADLKALAEQIQKMAGITIEANANDEGHLYGSVGAPEIVQGPEGQEPPDRAGHGQAGRGRSRKPACTRSSCNSATWATRSRAEVKVAVLKAAGKEVSSLSWASASRVAEERRGRRTPRGLAIACTRRWAHGRRNDEPDRLPPQSREAERAVLGSMLRDNSVIDDVVQILRTENFYADAHQKIFQAIVALHDKGPSRRSGHCWPKS